MHFVSTRYFLLLSLTLLLYWSLPWRRVRLLVVLVASYIFYMAWSEKLVVLLWFSTLLDFYCGSRIYGTEDDRARRRWLNVSLIGNLGMLGTFKYYNFFTDSFLAFMNDLGLHPNERTLYFVLPLGISFYTFQTLSYSIDIYRRQMRPTDSVLEFATFVAFFPQLVAGPIVRARDFLPQVVDRKQFDVREFVWGLERVLVGMVKKAVIADNLARVANPVFAAAAGTTSTHAWMAVIAFYGQLYCDFSGYSDIAIGCARLFGIRILENFDQPYLATSPRAFWSRWHISLSTWFRDYVYIPLGGNRCGATRTSLNLFLTFVLSGLWHGAAWTYALWGVYHGVWLLAHRAWSRAGFRLALPVALAAQVFFTCVGYFIFRAESWRNLVDILTAAAHVPTTLPTPLEWGALAWCALIFGLEPHGPRVRRWCQRPVVGPALWGALVGLGITLLMLAIPDTTPDFVYFVF